MRILMVTAEYAPLVKVGGLGDMVGSLAPALAASGHDVRVVLPLYGEVDRKRHHVRVLQKYPPVPLRVGQAVHLARLHQQTAGSRRVKVYFCENAELFGRVGVYTDATGREFPDALARAAFHAQAALALPVATGWSPQVVHCHDAATALVPVYARRWCRQVPSVSGAGTLLTIHNLAYQGIHPAAELDGTGLPREIAAYPGALEYHGQLNLMKAGILEADLVNTVSPTYAREVVADEDLGCGLAGVLRSRGSRFSGILNGADLETWDPRRDPALAAPFAADSLEGKQACRAALARELGLDDGGPVAGFVGRLVEQKGTELLLASLPRLLAEGVRLVVLATGEARYAAGLREAAQGRAGRLIFVDRFDEGLAHRIYAGCDLFLMPSRFEPCGLAQMYAMRYGAVPVVRLTGGLADTVADADGPDGTGLVFRPYTPGAFQEAVLRGAALWRDGTRWLALVRRAMSRRFSWAASAAAYEDLYAALAARPG
jgi:starch synthase